MRLRVELYVDWIYFQKKNKKVLPEANYHVLCLIRKQTEELCLFAVKQSYVALAYIRKQTPAIIKAAIQQSSDAEYYVDRA